MAKNTSSYYIAKAVKGGCIAKFGRGDHIKIYPPQGGRPMIIPQNLKGDGTEHAIIKWLRNLGILVMLAVIIKIAMVV